MCFPYFETTKGRILVSKAGSFFHIQKKPVIGYSGDCAKKSISKRAGRDMKAVQQNTGDSIRTILE
jgi:hypothetical protein